MLDFHKYFTDKNATDNKNDGDFFSVMMKSIITENARRNNESKETVLTQLTAQETNNFRQFKLAIEQQIKISLFVNISNLLRNWEKKYITKINALERKEQYTWQNVPDGEFKTCYSIFQKNNNYFHDDYHNTTVTTLSEKLKEITPIYKVLKKEDDFLQTEYLLELAATFQEATNSANKEWEMFENEEISMIKNNHAAIQIKLYDELNNKIIAKNKISKFKNFIIKILTFGKINKHKQITQEIANIKKQLQQDNANNNEEIENNKPIKQEVINEANQSQPATNNYASKNEQPVVTKQSLTL